METKFNQIAEKARTNPELVFNSIAHLLTPELLKVSFRKLNKKSAVGIDGISYVDYENNLINNIQELHQSLKSRTYEAKPLKRVWIDKGKGNKRPIGISCIADKIVQRAVNLI